MGQLWHRRVLLGVCLLALTGCARWNTAYRVSRLDTSRPVLVTVDAKQRHLLVAEGRLGGRALVACAEPAPDAFAVLAASGSGALGVDARSRTGQGSLGFSAAEAAATIERTQTVNLLRESFFRTCERYLSGAISRDAFILQAGRDARAMVAVLAIEQLTGAVRRPSTIISGPAAAAAAQLQNEIASLYPAAYRRREEAEKAYEPLRGKEKVDCDKARAERRRAAKPTRPRRQRPRPSSIAPTNASPRSSAWRAGPSPA